MSKLNKEQRRVRDAVRFRARVEQRRAEGGDVVAYALANGRAYKFLTQEEKEELRTRRAALEARRAAEWHLELAIADVMLRALKDGEDPNGPEAQAAVRKLRSDFRELRSSGK